MSRKKRIRSRSWRIDYEKAPPPLKKKPGEPEDSCPSCGGHVKKFRPVVDYLAPMNRPDLRYCPDKWHTVPPGAFDEIEM